MKKDSKVYLIHILDSIKRVESYLLGRDKNYFLSNFLVQDGVIRQVAIIGEAVKNIPLSLKHEYPKIPWRKIAAMRNIVIHEYFNIDLETTWRVVWLELPKLERQIKKVLEKIQKQ